MKLTGVRRDTHTVDVYTYLVANYGQPNQTVTFTYSETIKCRFDGVPGDPRCILYAAKPYARNIKIRNVKDDRGSEVMPNGDYRVTNVQPCLDIYGRLDGYRMSLALSNPNSFNGSVVSS